MTEISTDERRDYYRIADTVGLTYSAHEGDIPTEESFTNEIPDEFQLISHLNNIDTESSALLYNIQDISPEISKYLKVINTKIGYLARHVVTLGLNDEIQSQDVTLSAGGISFKTTEKLTEDSTIKLRMILYPSCSGILTYSKVIRCDKLDDNLYDTAVEYILINESDRDALVRHVLQLQSNYLRSKK